MSGCDNVRERYPGIALGRPIITKLSSYLYFADGFAGKMTAVYVFC